MEDYSEGTGDWRGGVRPDSDPTTGQDRTRSQRRGVGQADHREATPPTSSTTQPGASRHLHRLGFPPSSTGHGGRGGVGASSLGHGVLVPAPTSSLGTGAGLYVTVKKRGVTHWGRRGRGHPRHR